jgi:hypothetical protein
MRRIRTIVVGMAAAPVFPAAAAEITGAGSTSSILSLRRGRMLIRKIPASV